MLVSSVFSSKLNILVKMRPYLYIKSSPHLFSSTKLNILVKMLKYLYKSSTYSFRCGRKQVNLCLLSPQIFLKIIWDPRKNSVVSDIVLYRGALYGGSSVVKVSHYFEQSPALRALVLLCNKWTSGVQIEQWKENCPDAMQVHAMSTLHLNQVASKPWKVPTDTPLSVMASCIPLCKQSTGKLKRQELQDFQVFKYLKNHTGLVTANHIQLWTERPTKI